MTIILKIQVIRTIQVEVIHEKHILEASSTTSRRPRESGEAPIYTESPKISTQQLLQKKGYSQKTQSYGVTRHYHPYNPSSDPNQTPNPNPDPKLNQTLS